MLVAHICCIFSVELLLGVVFGSIVAMWKKIGMFDFEQEMGLSMSDYCELMGWTPYYVLMEMVDGDWSGVMSCYPSYRDDRYGVLVSLN